MGMTLLHALRLNARRNPQRVAVRFREHALSYGELLASTERAMCALAGLGIAPGEKVPMLSVNHPDMLVAYFALTGIGAIPAPLNYRLSDDDLRHGMSAAHARFVLLGSGFAERADALASPAWRWIWFADAESDAPAGAPRWQALLSRAEGPVPEGRAGNSVMLHTSGTTGRPKGVMQSHLSVVMAAMNNAIEFGLSRNDVANATLPLFHCAQHTLMFGLLVAGSTLVVMRGFDPVVVLDAIERERMSFMVGLPLMHQALLDHPTRPRRDLSSLRLCLYAMAPMPETLLRRLIAEFCPNYMLGTGQTEMYLSPSPSGRSSSCSVSARTGASARWSTTRP